MLKHCTQKSQWNETLYFSSRSTSWVTQALKNPMNYLDYSSFKLTDIFEKIFVIFILMYQCDNWTIDKSWALNNWCFELWCWRRFLRVPGTARRTNQSILKEISPEYSLEGLMLGCNSNILATWYKELTHLKWPWCRERLKAGGEGDDKG